MNSYQDFNPTYLYIKQHSITGKLYFGKTQLSDPEKYLGSGKRWTRHIKNHGKEHVITLWYCLFLTRDSIIEFAITCSKMWNIVNSDEWLNLREENGIDGNPKGIKFSAETNAKKVMTGDRNGMFGKTHSEKIKESSRRRAIDMFKGKTYDELYGHEKAIELKKIRSEHGKCKNNSGKNNPRALKIIAVSPFNEEFLIEGGLKAFCNEHSLGLTTVIRSMRGKYQHFSGWTFNLLGSVYGE